MRKYFWNLKNCANICTNKSQKIIMPQMFSQLFVQIFALYKFFCKNLRKKRRKFSMDPICKNGWTRSLSFYRKFHVIQWCLKHVVGIFIKLWVSTNAKRFHAEDNINQIRILGTNYLELRPFPPTYDQVKENKIMADSIM